MLDTIYKYDRNEEQIKAIDKYIHITAMIMLLVVPLIMYRHDLVNYGPILSGNAYATGPKIDVFNYYKAVMFNGLTYVMIGLFIYKVTQFNYKIKETKLNIVMMIMAGVIVITPLFAKYTDIAFFGNHDRYEGALTWFSYLSVFFILYNTVIEEKMYKYFYWVLVPFIVVNLTLGVLHTYGVNILENETVNNFLGGGLGGFIITTLYNQNFGSAMASVVFCLSFMYLLLEEDMRVKCALVITSVASFAMLLTMMSSGGFITVIAMIPVMIVIGMRFRKITSVIISSGAVLVLSTIAYKGLVKINPRIANESFGLLTKINDVSGAIIPGAIVVFVVAVVAFKFMGSKRKVVFDVIAVTTVVAVIATGVFASMAIEKEKEMIAQNPETPIVRIEDKPLYQTINTLSSTRLEIWMDTVDLINESPLLGHGFDTYPYVMYELDEDKGITSIGQFADKPHNWYINVAYGSGIFALVGLLALILYISRKMIANISDKIDSKYIYIFGIGVISYAAQAIFNDSFVGTAIIFWIAGGICITTLSNKKEA